jgi:hypothetical protein
MLQEPWQKVPLQERCAWYYEQVSYQRPLQVARVPCQSLHRDHCLFFTFRQSRGPE